MANIEKRKTYRCIDDCKIEGCPVHEAILKIQTTSDAYTFIGRNGEPKYFERQELQTFLDLLGEVNRADIVKFPEKCHCIEAAKEEGLCPHEEFLLHQCQVCLKMVRKGHNCEENDCKINYHIPTEEGDACLCGYFISKVNDDINAKDGIYPSVYDKQPTDLLRNLKCPQCGLWFIKCIELNNYIKTLLEAQKTKDADIIKSLFFKNLKTEEYFGVYGEVNLKQFIKDFLNQ